jgi:hypothetical protein
MSISQDLNELACRFAQDTEFARSVAMRDLERSVCGRDYGGTSWTPRREAERITQLLELRPGTKLLDGETGAAYTRRADQTRRRLNPPLSANAARW